MEGGSEERKEGERKKENRKQYSEVISYFPKFLSGMMGIENKLIHSDI